MQADNKVPTPDKRQTAIMMAQYKKATSEPNEFIKFAMSPDNGCVWYIRIYNFAGNEDEFVGGEYDCRMVAPIDFPFNPPSFYFLTSNGLYEVETKVCISIGEFHKDEYRAGLGMAGFANQLVSGLVGWKDMGGGINIIKTSLAKKRELAYDSRASNKAHHSDICLMIEESYKGYSAKWDISKIPTQMATRLGLLAAASDTTASDKTASDKTKVDDKTASDKTKVDDKTKVVDKTAEGDKTANVTTASVTTASVTTASDETDSDETTDGDKK
jgi:ubiquitin-protein ligase